MMNKKIVISCFLLVLMIGVLSCIPLTQIGGNENKKSETFSETVLPTKTMAETVAPSETPTQPILLTATLYGSLMPPTPDASMQTYVDPEGWFQVQFPAEFVYSSKSGSYFSGSRYFKTEYLPEYGNMEYGLNICAWIVNVVEENPEDYYINWMGEGSCEINTRAAASRQSRMVIYENPSADAEHRFLYTKVGWGSRDAHVPIKFNWIKSTGDTAFVNDEIDYDTPPQGWDDFGLLMDGVSVTEIELAPGVEPYRQDRIKGLNGEDLFGSGKSDNVPVTTPTPQEAFVSMSGLGYSIEIEEVKRSGAMYPKKQLFRDGRILFDDVENVSSFYFVENGENSFVTFEVKTYLGEAFLVQNDVIHPWTTEFQDPRYGALIYNDSVLWLKTSEDWDQINVIQTNPEQIETIYSWTVSTEPMFSINRFMIWNDQWVITAGDFLIKDGMVMNAELGVQEIFNWQVINDREIYLFRKDGRVGLSNGDSYYPLPYQKIARNMCCGYAGHNPGVSAHKARFFATRDGVWYYVIIEY